jgi:hypothetical protein
VNWDETVELMGSYPIHWSVTMDEEQEVVVFLSPFQQMPDEDTSDGAERTGTQTMLAKPLTVHQDHELIAAAQIMVRMAVKEWIEPRLVYRIYMAMREQRERQGGYIAGTTPFVEENKPPEEEG